MPLHDKLKQLNTYPFHMPGHKRNPSFQIAGSALDITEIAGFDNLHAPQGILLEIENRLAAIYNSRKSFMLVNGSTVGILAAIFAVCSEGDKIIIARNCHKSVYNACMLRHLKIVYLEPEYDKVHHIYMRISQDSVDRIIQQHPDAQAVVITSPTYEGYISSVQSPIPLIIDAAHGAHLGLGGFPDYPNGSIVVSSLHKTLPALTQTAVLNVYDKRFTAAIKFYLDIFETSSPSYLLMDSVEQCCDYIENHTVAFNRFHKQLADFKKDIEKISLFPFNIVFGDDISKIMITTENADVRASELAATLRTHYLLEPEMVSLKHILLMTSVGDTPQAFERLKQALYGIQQRFPLSCKMTSGSKPPLPKKILEIILPETTEETALSACAGKIAGEFVYAYPPDIPLIVPNEIISEEILLYIEKMQTNGICLISDSGLLPKKILTKAKE